LLDTACLLFYLNPRWNHASLLVCVICKSCGFFIRPCTRLFFFFDFTCGASPGATRSLFPLFLFLDEKATFLVSLPLVFLSVEGVFVPPPCSTYGSVFISSPSAPPFCLADSYPKSYSALWVPCWTTEAAFSGSLEWDAGTGLLEGGLFTFSCTSYFCRAIISTFALSSSDLLPPPPSYPPLFFPPKILIVFLYYVPPTD